MGATEKCRWKGEKQEGEKEKKKQEGEGMRMGWRARLGLFRTPGRPDSSISNFDQLFLFILRAQVDIQ